MNLREAITEVRRKMGFILPTKSDMVWAMDKFVRENKKVFGELAKS